MLFFDNFFSYFQMTCLWAWAITPRGRKIYLLMATGLFVLSMSLLVMRSWSGRMPLKNLEDSYEFYKNSQISESNYLRYSRKEWEEKVNKESQRGLTWLVQVSNINDAIV